MWRGRVFLFLARVVDSLHQSEELFALLYTFINHNQDSILIHPFHSHSPISHLHHAPRRPSHHRNALLPDHCMMGECMKHCPCTLSTPSTPSTLFPISLHWLLSCKQVCLPSRHPLVQILPIIILNVPL